MTFRDMSEYPENTIVFGLMPPGNVVVRVKYDNDGTFAPQWKYCDAPRKNQLAPWPLGWLHLHEVEA